MVHMSIKKFEEFPDSSETYYLAIFINADFEYQEDLRK